MTTPISTARHAFIEDFEKSWGFIRSMTYEFIEAVPPEHWHFSPHPGCAPLAKQFRHMAWLSGVYNDTLRNRVLDFAKKKTFYSGGLERAELVAALRSRDEELKQLLRDVENGGVDSCRVEMPFLGRAMRFGEFTNLLIQHECLHHGLWSLYARFAGFVTPQSWLFNFGL